MKTQNEFLEVLEEELKYLKQQEINEIVKHYREKISVELDYGTPEEKVIKSLPNPKDIAREIYEARGVSFIEIQKKKYRRKEIMSAIISSLIVLLMSVTFFSITIFVGYSIASICSLGIKALGFKSILDILLMSIFVVLYIVTIALGYIFLIDLFYIIISHFLVNILKANKKTYKPYYKFNRFTINGFINEKCKGKKILPIVLSCFVVGLLITGVGSYLTKGYIYRSFNDTPSLSKTEEYDAKLKEINIEGVSASIILEIDPTLTSIKIDYKYEFDNTFEIISESLNLKISKNNIESFDIFGLFNEPRPQVLIKLPSDDYLNKLNIKLDDGYVYLKNINSLKLDVVVDVYDVDLYLENITLKTLDVDSYDGNVRIMNTSSEVLNDGITNMTVEITKGNIYMQDIKVYDKIDIDNKTAEIIFNRCELNTFELDNLSGDVVLNETSGNTLTYKTSSRANVIDNLNYSEAAFELTKSCYVKLTRTMVESKLTITTYGMSTAEVKYLKSKETNIKNNSGIVSLENINQKVKIDSEEDQELQLSKQKYNDFNVIKTTINVESSAETDIHYSKIDELNVTQAGTILYVSKTYIEKADINAEESKNLTFSDVIGKNISFTLKNSPLKYYNYPEEPEAAENNDKSNYYDMPDFRFKLNSTGLSKLETNLEYDLVK